ncbi:peptidoglycan recognition protein 1-like [Diorhabda sublineata]|uniref:peptidoglycan recognition protein 1-like n=1 Tax=Diorhabda sublineata TaxID=1163346 RepID=UPI0024E0CABA|nr:peptidoglycan recognition protein 1-like [Diorhabda sublineata]
MTDNRTKPDAIGVSTEKISAEIMQTTPNNKLYSSNDSSPADILVGKNDSVGKSYLTKIDGSNRGGNIDPKESSRNPTTPKSVTINLSANKLKESLDNDTNADEDRTEESTPLIPRSNTIWSICDKIWLVTFILMVIVGLFVGVSLLIWLGYEKSNFHLIVKSKWTTVYPTREMVKLKLPLRKVSLIEIDASDGNVCGGNYYYSSCVRVIQNRHMNELKEPDILYNFIVDQDGTIYEGRGWENCTCNGEFLGEQLTIGILVNDGNIGHKVPIYVKNFLGKAENKLVPCFTISTHNDTVLKPVVQRVKEVIDWNNCSQPFQQ